MQLIIIQLSFSMLHHPYTGCIDRNVARSVIFGDEPSLALIVSFNRRRPSFDRDGVYRVSNRDDNNKTNYVFARYLNCENFIPYIITFMCSFDEDVMSIS